MQWEDTRFRFGDHPHRALRTARYTYAVGRDDAFCMLFDHEQDPYELDNPYWNHETRAVRQETSARLVTAMRAVGEEVGGM